MVDENSVITSFVNASRSCSEKAGRKLEPDLELDEFSQIKPLPQPPARPDSVLPRISPRGTRDLGRGIPHALWLGFAVQKNSKRNGVERSPVPHKSPPSPTSRPGASSESSYLL